MSHTINYQETANKAPPETGSLKWVEGVILYTMKTHQQFTTADLKYHDEDVMCLIAPFPIDWSYKGPPAVKQYTADELKEFYAEPRSTPIIFSGTGSLNNAKKACRYFEIIIAQEKGSAGNRDYIVCSLESYCKMHKQSMRGYIPGIPLLPTRTYHDFLRNLYPTKGILDIDVPLDKPEQFTLNEFDSFINLFIECFCKVLYILTKGDVKIVRKDFLVYYMCKVLKLSAHALLARNDIMFGSTGDLAIAICMTLRQMLIAEVRRIGCIRITYDKEGNVTSTDSSILNIMRRNPIDTSIYTRDHTLRGYFSSKIGEYEFDRVKKLSTDLRYEDYKEENLLASLPQYSPLFENEKISRLIVVGQFEDHCAKNLSHSQLLLAKRTLQEEYNKRIDTWNKAEPNYKLKIIYVKERVAALEKQRYEAMMRSILGVKHDVVIGRTYTNNEKDRTNVKDREWLSPARLSLEQVAQVTKILNAIEVDIENIQVLQNVTKDKYDQRYKECLRKGNKPNEEKHDLLINISYVNDVKGRTLRIKARGGVCPVYGYKGHGGDNGKGGGERTIIFYPDSKYISKELNVYCRTNKCNGCHAKITISTKHAYTLNTLLYEFEGKIEEKAKREMEEESAVTDESQ